MDDNTKDILMAIIEIISVIVTALMLIRVNRSNVKIDDVKNDVHTVHTKVDEYRKEINGHMTALLETTKDLATAKEKARGEAENKQ